MIRLSIICGCLVLFFTCNCAAPPPPTAVPSASMQPAAETPVVRLGYCPTMQDDVDEMTARYPSLQPLRFPNAASAIQAVHSGQADAILIGRKIHAHETPQNLAIHPLRPGYTLITETQRAVGLAELAGMTVHTALPASIAQPLLPAGTMLVTHPDLEEAMENGLASAVLISWEEVQPWHQLLIPVDAQGNKIAVFRAPFLVYQAGRSSELEYLLYAIQP